MQQVSESRSRWIVLTVGVLGLVISNGLAIGGIPVFSKPIQTEFVERGIVAAGHAQTFIANASRLTFLMSGVSSLVGGWLLRYLSMKKLMLIGCVMLGLAFVAHALTSSEGVIYAARSLMGTSLGFVGVTPSVILISNWFNKGRGTALGILLTGTSIGGFIAPVVFAWLITRYQWRPAMLIVSAAVWVVLLPLVAIFIRDPDEIAAKENKDVPAGYAFKDALKTRQFWLFASAAALVFYTIFVTTQQFILYLQSPRIGLSLTVASYMQSILFALSISGKSAAGVLSDKFSSSKVTLVSTAMMFASTLVLFFGAAPLAFLIIYGLGYGATFVLLQRLAAEYFGRRDYGRILGTITMIETLGGVVGGGITGYLADAAGGDYSTAFYVMIFVTAAIFICMFALERSSPRALVQET
jgi:MFS family permease